MNTKRSLLVILAALALCGCGGSGAGGNQLAGSYSGTWVTASPKASGPATVVVSPSGVVSGTVQGTLTSNGLASFDFNGTYSSLQSTGSFWPVAAGLGGSVSPIGSGTTIVFTLTRN